MTVAQIEAAALGLDSKALEAMLPIVNSSLMNVRDASRFASVHHALNKETLFEEDGLQLPWMPSASDCLSGPFPCLADELEEQAKALEHGWLAAPSSLPLVPTPSKPLAPLLPVNDVPALKHSSLEKAQTKAAALTVAATFGLPPPPEHQQQHSVAAPAAAPFGAMPHTPRSNHHNNNKHPTAALLEQQQPIITQQEISAAASPALVQTNRAPAIAPLAPRIAPLPMAMRNAQCVCLGKPSPAIGAWRGCATNPWCNKEGGHTGACNCRASIPGLAAYSTAELQQAGIATSTDEVDALQGGTSAASSFLKRRAMMDDVNDTVSDNNSNTDEPETTALGHHINHNNTSTGRGNKRTRRGAAHNNAPLPPSATTLKRTSNASTASAAYIKDVDQDGDSTSEELRSTNTAEAKIADLAIMGGNRRGGGHNTDTTHHHHHHHRGLGPKAAPLKEAPTPRAGTIKKTQRQWVTDSVVDPRTGETLTTVPPANFCTQCSTLSTPVWRAGPFGHKTLCNACGVRWMKVAPKLRK